MHYILIKTFAAIIILFAALFGGLIPLYSRYRNLTNILDYGIYFARGIFLGAGLIHLLPDAIHDLADFAAIMRYPLVMAIVASTIFILQLVEQGSLLMLPKKNSNQSNWLPYLLLTVLSIHSIIAGAVLGLGSTFTAIAFIFIAIIAHKSAAAFALGIEMLRHHLKNKSMIKILLLFSLMTPIGIFLGSFLEVYLRSSSGLLASGIFNAIAAGTFIYIGTFNHIDSYENEEREKFTLANIGFFGLGILLMATVAIWL